MLINSAFEKGYDDGKSARAFAHSQQAHTIPGSSYQLARAYYSAGWELARSQRGIGKLPLLIHTGRRFYWIVAIEPEGPVFQATQPDERPDTRTGYFDLAALFVLKGEPMARTGKLA